MSFSKQQLQNMAAVYKYVFENPSVHRNVLRKALLNKGKIASKEKFFQTLEGLIALDKVKLEKENVSLNPDIIKVGVLQKEGNDFYVVTPNSKRHLPVDRSVAAGYKSGDVLDIVVEYEKQQPLVIVLGKSQKTANNKIAVEHTAATPPHEENGLILGRVIKLSHDNLVFIPNKKSFETRQIPILNNKEEMSKFQDKLCLMKLENVDAPILGGHIVKVKGDAGNMIHEYDAIAESYGAIMSWDDAEEEIAKIPTSVDVSKLNLISEQEAMQNGQKGKTVDLRHLAFTTVDPATCKDMDDAIYSTIDEDGNIVCYTAVANVSKYVSLNSVIGQKYINGAFTIYAPNKAYSVLSNNLSTGICSLNPNEDRLAFVIKTTLDAKTGEVKHSNIYDAIIRSKQKYSYEQAQEIVDRTDVAGVQEYLVSKMARGEELSLPEQVVANYYAAKCIKEGFIRRVMLRFTSNKEREIVFDADMQDVIDIKPIEHLRYHEVIEEFMITANEATAKYAKDNKLNTIYRIHEKPIPKKVDRANEFFDILGIDFDGDLSAQGTRNLIEIIRGSANEEVINNFLIKMQSRAVYSNKLYGKNATADSQDWLEQRISHYALQSPHYSHSTSPIRRSPDYVVHYNILADIHNTKPLSAGAISDIIEIANERQLEVDQAEKDFADISSVIYCEKHIGEKMSGRITKIRHASLDEGYEDDIVVIAKNDETGVSVEIPLSQVVGRPAYDCFISEQSCAVYDSRGNTLLTLCKPIDFIIEKADRKTMTVVGKTSKEMVNQAIIRDSEAQQRYLNSKHAIPGDKHKHDKHKRDERRLNNKHHHDKNHADIEKERE